MLCLPSLINIYLLQNICECMIIKLHTSIMYYVLWIMNALSFKIILWHKIDFFNWLFNSLSSNSCLTHLFFNITWHKLKSPNIVNNY